MKCLPFLCSELALAVRVRERVAREVHVSLVMRVPAVFVEPDAAHRACVRLGAFPDVESDVDHHLRKESRSYSLFARFDFGVVEDQQLAGRRISGVPRGVSKCKLASAFPRDLMGVGLVGGDLLQGLLVFLQHWEHVELF